MKTLEEIAREAIHQDNQAKWDHMSHEHGLHLLESQIDDIDRLYYGATLDAIYEALAQERERTCEWVNNDDFWSTSCGQDFCFIDQGPKENGFKGCPYCRGKIEVVKEKIDK